MITLEETLIRLGGELDRKTLEDYVSRTWVRPVIVHAVWHFEEIDIARLRLIRELRQDMLVGDDAMDIVLNLLDQLYGLRDNLLRIQNAIDAREDEAAEDELPSTRTGL